MRGNDVELNQKPGITCEVDFLHRLAEHVAKGDTFDETLASAIDFAVWLVSCDECVAYVREAEQLVPWVWKYSADRTIEQSRLPIARDCVQALSDHLEPIAVSQGVDAAPRARNFCAWLTQPGETSVWIPLVARSKLLGALHLEHRYPRPYGRHEFNALSSMGRILGSDLCIAQLESENSDLRLQLETWKPVERGKGILPRDLGLSEEEASLALERQGRQKCRDRRSWSDYHFE